MGSFCRCSWMPEQTIEVDKWIQTLKSLEMSNTLFKKPHPCVIGGHLSTWPSLTAGANLAGVRNVEDEKLKVKPFLPAKGQTRF